MNQHGSTKADLIRALGHAREALRGAATARRAGNQPLYHYFLDDARYFLALFRATYNRSPASTRRRWACGR